MIILSAGFGFALGITAIALYIGYFINKGVITIVHIKGKK